MVVDDYSLNIIITVGFFTLFSLMFKTSYGYNYKIVGLIFCGQHRRVEMET